MLVKMLVHTEGPAGLAENLHAFERANIGRYLLDSETWMLRENNVGLFDKILYTEPFI